MQSVLHSAALLNTRRFRVASVHSFTAHCDSLRATLRAPADKKKLLFPSKIAECLSKKKCVCVLCVAL